MDVKKHRSNESSQQRWNTHRSTEDRDEEHDSKKDRSSEMELTELDAPPPARQEKEHGHVEEAEQLARRCNTSGDTYANKNAELTENAAPPPVATDEENFIDAPNDLQSFEKKPKLEQTSQGRRRPSRGATELYTVSWLVFFSILGTLARLGVEAITLYPNTPFPSRVLWANLGGSFFMGFLAEDRRLFRQEWGDPDPDASPSNHRKVRKTIPLFIGLATGFCGSFTSFSSFMRDAFLALSNAESASSTSPYHSAVKVPSRNGGFSLLALMAILIIHPAVSIAAMQTGAQFALLVQPVTPTLPFRFVRRILDPLAVVLGFGCWLGAMLLSALPPGNDTHWRFRAAFPILFAPPGCLLRFYVSKHLNARIPSFPLGTFTVNIFGTVVLGMAWDLQHARTIGASPKLHLNACSILQGIIEGFCGCTTTVSTWVAELLGLRRRHAWIYGLTSVGVGLGLITVIMGSMGWTVGFGTPPCH